VCCAILVTCPFTFPSSGIYKLSNAGGKPHPLLTPLAAWIVHEYLTPLNFTLISEFLFKPWIALHSLIVQKVPTVMVGESYCKAAMRSKPWIVPFRITLTWARKCWASTLHERRICNKRRTSKECQFSEYRYFYVDYQSVVYYTQYLCMSIVGVSLKLRPWRVIW
jgi:hypothetical protein